MLWALEGQKELPISSVCYFLEEMTRRSAGISLNVGRGLLTQESDLQAFKAFPIINS